MPSLRLWDEGDKFLDEIKFLIYKRKGYDTNLASDNIDMPKTFIVAESSDIGLNSSTEVRNMI